MSDEDIKLLRENDLCVVVSQDPPTVKFLDPIPSASQRGQIDRAAIRLSRILLNGRWGDYSNSGVIGRADFARIYVDLLIKGTELDAFGSTDEQEQKYFSNEKMLALRQLARDEAKAERAAAKAAAKEKGKA